MKTYIILVQAESVRYFLIKLLDVREVLDLPGSAAMGQLTVEQQLSPGRDHGLRVWSGIVLHRRWRWCRKGGSGTNRSTVL